MGIASVGLCCLAALLLRRRPDLLVLIYVALWVLVPHVFFEEVPIALGFHPASILILAGFCTSLLLSSPSGAVAWKRSINRRSGTWAALLVFLALAAGIQLTSGHVAMAFRLSVEQILAPLAMFALARAAVDFGLPIRRRAPQLVIVLGAFEAALAIIQRALGTSVPFETYYRTQTWYVPEVWNRYSGTLDHPLVLGLLIAVAMWLLPTVRSVALRFGLAVLYLFGVGAAQSRTALVLSAAGLIALLLTSKMSALQRLASVAVAGAAVTWGWQALARSDAISRLITDDGGSSAGRFEVYQLFLSSADQFVIFGGGTAYSQTFAAGHGSAISLENPFMMYAVDYGLVAAVFYFAAQLVIALRGFRVPEQRFLAAAGLIAIAATQSFSSLETQSASAALLWLVLALVDPAAPRTESAEVATGAGTRTPRLRPDRITTPLRAS